MKTIDIKQLKIAKKYANALFQTALELDKNEKVYDDIVFVSETIRANEQLQSVLKNPVVSISDKKDIVSRLFGIHVEKITLDFIFLLIENNRLYCLDEVVNSYNESKNKNNNIINPVITSAIELTEEQKGRIITKLESKTNKKVIPEYNINSDIIGGIIVEINDKTIDCSLRAKFENMRKSLIKGHSYGNN